MVDEEYQKLGIGEQEEFSRLVNQLLAHTFVTAEMLTTDENAPLKTDPDYLFIEAHYELFEQYLAMAGFSLERDSGYGIISLRSNYDGNRIRFDKLTTIMVYTLRLIYDETREQLTLSKEVWLTTGQLIQKMMALGAIPKKPSALQLRTSLALLCRFQVIAKNEGKWEEIGTRFLIMPTILFIVSNEQIAQMARLIEEPESAFGEGDDLEEEQ